LTLTYAILIVNKDLLCLKTKIWTFSFIPYMIYVFLIIYIFVTSNINYNLQKWKARVIVYNRLSRVNDKCCYIPIIHLSYRKNKIELIVFFFSRMEIESRIFVFSFVNLAVSGSCINYIAVFVLLKRLV